MVPPEIISKIYVHSNFSINMLLAFDWLKQYLPKCECCGKPAKFILNTKLPLKRCPYCKQQEPQDNQQLVLCNLKCKNLYWMLEKYNIKSQYRVTADRFSY
ncbi:hypothetical protein EB118_19115 [bacterium]|nr:hypothetical protein [bacterium]